MLIFEIYLILGVRYSQTRIHTIMYILASVCLTERHSVIFEKNVIYVKNLLDNNDVALLSVHTVIHKC